MINAKFRVQLKRLARDRDGNFAVLGAIAIIPIIGAAALAIDFAGAYLEAEKMQGALDAAAIGSVRAYGEGASEDEAYEAAKKFFWANYALPQDNVVELLAAPTEPSTQNALTVKLTRSVNEDTATAEFGFDYKPLFLERLPLQIRRQAVAARAAGAEACILALNETADRAFNVSGSAVADLTGCSIVSNSSDDQSIYVGGTGKLKAECLYAAGGIYGSPQAVSLACESAVEGSPRVPDPFASKVTPKTSAWVDLSGCGQGFVAGGGGNGDCNGTGKTPKDTAGYVVTLKPGTYGSLEFKGAINLQPGNYIIDGGRLELGSQTVVNGQGVTFFLMNDAELTIHGGATFNISPALDGVWAGFSIVAEHGNQEAAIINGNSQSSLTGIIYLPDVAELQYAGNGTTSGECIRLIAQQITLIGNSTFKMDCSAELANTQFNYPGAIRLVH
ncbi:pilus assembly protein TadG-related protein [Sinorhizobium numidicum]|uniref:Pilus assembly protein TadG-related protein n=1 Tax=Sinorhizobium numidicum TaxID=680248 RepID=A0ABY8CU63_9HYPH|nr:pilus assembly protein TadG-related protein [Sinorhizobium numidicum]WEX74555.1 pilus assembly protein TadG-related protein [Sinorhizobium numidicum]WEX80546.1 pilus assembly protein TadG-related protein [Sinorhizobium numidicum]